MSIATVVVVSVLRRLGGVRRPARYAMGRILLQWPLIVDAVIRVMYMIGGPVFNCGADTAAVVSAFLSTAALLVLHFFFFLVSRSL